MLQRRKIAVCVGQEELTVWEANWDMSVLPDHIAAQAHEALMKEQDRSKVDLLSFTEIVYPWLAAYTEGKTPSAQEAFELPDTDLDAWYMAVRQVNPTLFLEELPADAVVTFRDGSSFIIKSAYLPSSLRRLIHLDNLASSYLLDNPSDIQTFSRLKVYAKLACCSIGDVPTYDQIHDWPAEELGKWYTVALRTNPHLFLTGEEISEAQQARKTETDSKKNSPPPKSSGSLKASSKKKVTTSQA